MPEVLLYNNSHTALTPSFFDFFFLVLWYICSAGAEVSVFYIVFLKSFIVSNESYCPSATRKPDTIPMVATIRIKTTRYLPNSPFSSLGKSFASKDFSSLLPPYQSSSAAGILCSFMIIFTNHPIAKLHHPVSHIFDGIVVRYHDDGVAIFLIYRLDQLQDFLGGIIIQCPCRLIAEKNVRILHNGTCR